MTNPLPDHASYVDAWRARWHDERARDTLAISARRCAADLIVTRVVAALVSELGVTHVWVVGSMARGELGLTSDIDLAVDGLAPECWLDAERIAERIAGEAFVVEIVPLGLANKRYLDALAREGRLLHGP